jgi:hypothetical protein
MTAAGEQFVRMDRIHDHSEFRPRRAACCVPQFHAFGESGSRHPRPWHFLGLRIYNHHAPDRTSFRNIFSPLFARLIVSLHVSWDRRRTSSYEHGDFSFLIHPGEIVVMLFLNFQSVSDKTAGALD